MLGWQRAPHTVRVQQPRARVSKALGSPERRVSLGCCGQGSVSFILPVNRLGVKFLPQAPSLLCPQMPH